MSEDVKRTPEMDTRLAYMFTYRQQYRGRLLRSSLQWALDLLSTPFTVNAVVSGIESTWH